MSIKAIETQYKGYRFRSRLEARWAVFFDALGIEWEYEKEGYDLGVLGPYLPDFWLPQVNMWAEVKPGEFSEQELHKCICLARETGYSVIMLEGMPGPFFYGTIGPEFPEPIPEDTRVFVSNYHNYHVDEQRFYSHPGWNTPEEEGILSDSDLYAITAARSARFEHGEAPRMALRRVTR